jgi:hypothetical protein
VLVRINQNHPVTGAHGQEAAAMVTAMVMTTTLARTTTAAATPMRAAMRAEEEDLTESDSPQ